MLNFLKPRTDKLNIHTYYRQYRYLYTIYASSNLNSNKNQTLISEQVNLFYLNGWLCLPTYLNITNSKYSIFYQVQVLISIILCFINMLYNTALVGITIGTYLPYVVSSIQIQFIVLFWVSHVLNVFFIYHLNTIHEVVFKCTKITMIVFHAWIIPVFNSNTIAVHKNIL